MVRVMKTIKRQIANIEKIREVSILTSLTAVMAAAVFFFLEPSKAAVSSIAGAAIIINGVIDLPVSLITLVLNLLLIAVGLVIFGKAFAFNTIYTCVLLSAFLAALELLFPDYTSFTGSAELDVICYVIIVSWALAILFRHNAASSGLDIIAQIMNKYLHIEVGRALSIAGICIALSSALVYDGKTVVLSVLGTYFNGIVLDRLIFGQNIKRRVSVITDREKELEDFVLNDLKCGATVYRATGAYTHAEFNELVIIVGKSEYQRLMSFVRGLDPDAFVAVYTVSEVSRKSWDAAAQNASSKRTKIHSLDCT